MFTLLDWFISFFLWLFLDLEYTDMPQYGVQGSMLYTYQKNKYAQYIVKGCDFNMCFTFVVGLEDNVNDS